PGLGHVNTYALIDDRGAAVVDPGMPGPLTWRTLRRRLHEIGVPLRHVHTVVVTHSHPDHFGTAGRLAKEAGAELVTQSAFRTFRPGRTRPDQSDAGAGPEGNPFASVPWGGARPRPPRGRMLAFRVLRAAGQFMVPQPTTRLDDGDTIKLAGREWTALHTPGHTLDHLCLHDPDEGLLLSGDHVLPTITPHVAGVGAGPDPLRSYLASLRRVDQLAHVRRVLPAHGHPFDDLRGRVSAIERHHRERLVELRGVSSALGPATVEALSRQLFRPARWGPMAQSETYAHLEHLRLAGEAERYEEGGKLLYRVAPGSSPGDGGAPAT
ncbi:MAG TPA: MBL fold metallo-hydrolase, partial [Acidimicrobiales bacterium]|nr:MBL fold metallo-hydrolase [Acidimicrobiales bacterium]